MSALSLLIGIVFCGVAVYSHNPVMDARAWVVAPIFIATSFICLAIELLEDSK